jgi:serine/threonine protein kinase
LVYDFIDATTLASRQKKLGLLSAHDSAKVVADLAESLSRAHAKGVYHRDVSPHNVLLEQTPAGYVPWLIDFGVGLRFEDRGMHEFSRCGTLRFMSPEQAQGKSDSIDGRSDVYGLGAVLFWLLTNRAPFEAETDDLLVQQISDSSLEAPDLREFDPASERIPSELASICGRALFKDKNRRFKLASDMGRALRTFCSEKRTNLRTPDGHLVG